MKSTVEKVSNLGRKLNIEISGEIVSSTLQKMLKGIQKEANIKGFRPGKAPMNTIKTVYGDRVKQDLAQELIQKHYLNALREHKLEPISYPEFEFDAPKESQDFVFTAHFEIRPEISLKKYEGIEIEKEKYVFEDAKVDKVLENIRTSKSELVDVLELRPAIKGDTSIIDFEGTVEGKPLENGKGTGQQLELGSNSFIEGFEEGIEGMNVGENRTISLKFPDDYHAKDIAGKPVQFNITLKGLKKKVIPEMSDEFLKSIGSDDTVTSLKIKIKDDLEASDKKRIEGDLKNRILKKLVELNPVEVPNSMLTEQKNILIEDMKNRMAQQGIQGDEFESYKVKWNKDFEKTAAEMIQSGFLVDAIANKHELIWNDEDLKTKIQEYAKQTGIEMEKIAEFYNRPDQKQRVTYLITEDKVISFILKTAKLKEVEKEKLTPLAE